MYKSIGDWDVYVRIVYVESERASCMYIGCWRTGLVDFLTQVIMLASAGLLKQAGLTLVVWSFNSVNCYCFLLQYSNDIYPNMILSKITDDIESTHTWKRVWGVKLHKFRNKEWQLCVAIAVNLPDGEICLCDFISSVSILLLISIWISRGFRGITLKKIWTFTSSFILLVFTDHLFVLIRNRSVF